MPREASVTIGGRSLRGRFQVLMVSTLQALVLTGRLAPPRDGSLGLVAMERRRSTVFRSVFAGFVGKVGHKPIPGLHFEAGDEIHLGAELADAIMDGESFHAAPGHGIHLHSGPSVRFIDLALGARAPARAADEAARDAAAAATARAAPTLLAYARGVAPDAEPLELWREGFARTYASELRAERDDRPAKIVAQDPARYRAFAEAALADGLPPLPRAPAAAWRRFARRGKRLSVLRLLKALTTFSGGPNGSSCMTSASSGTSLSTVGW
jgi:hypothetical protein